MLVSGESGTHSGDEVTAGARVLAEVASHGRAAKVVVFKYKPKVRYRRKSGHRQHYTELLVREIVAGGERAVAESKQAGDQPQPGRARRTRAAKAEIEESVADVAAGALADSPEAELDDTAPSEAASIDEAVAETAEGALADTPEAEVEQASAEEPAPKPRRARKKKEDQA